MMKLNYFNQLNINITWTLISINFVENLPFFNEISVQDIVNYAIEILKDDSADSNDAILELACESINNRDSISKLVNLLSKYEKSNCECELEKWKVCYLWNEIRIKSDNFINGLCKLTDVWSHIGYDIASCPHIIQGVNNTMTPSEYYTAEMYDVLYQNNINWIAERSGAGKTHSGND